MSTTPVTCSETDGKIIIQATGNNLEYSLNAGTLRTANSFDKLPAGDYVILIKDGVNCTISQKVTLRADCQKMVFIPTGFSPNGDGLNDQLSAYFPFASLTFKSVSVYNRWGNAVYGAENIVLKSGEALWDGLFNGKPPTLGNYVVVAEAAFEDGTTHVFRQQVEVLR
jgi:gliding motility-associated-like protein